MDKKKLAFYTAVAETIRDMSAVSPLGGVPSGELYALLSGKISLEGWQALVSSLVAVGLIKNEGHLLKWVGPK